MVGEAKRRTINIGRSTAVFLNFDKCQPEVAGDVISIAALVYASADVCTKFGDSRLNNGRTIRPFVRPDPFYALLCSI